MQSITIRLGNKSSYHWYMVWHTWSQHQTKMFHSSYSLYHEWVGSELVVLGAGSIGAGVGDGDVTVGGFFWYMGEGVRQLSILTSA